MCNPVRPPRASSLSGDVLRGRLRELASDERAAQIDFLLHLSEFDRRKGFLDAGYGSLWMYCLRELRLREGPAARRIAAMRVLRQYAALEAPLRDGRLCMTTVTLIAPLIAEVGVDELVARAANLTRAEVEHLVATLRPSAAPRDGVRQLASRQGPPMSIQATRLEARPTETDADLMSPPWPDSRASASATPFANRPGANASPFADASTVSSMLAGRAGSDPFGGQRQATDELARAGSLGMSEELQPSSASAFTADQGDHRGAEQGDRRAAELRPVAAEQWSLRVTMDARMKEDLETLRSLLSHTAGGDLTAIVREALRCAVERHGKRRGLIAPTRRSSAGPVSDGPVSSAPSAVGPSTSPSSTERPSTSPPSPGSPSTAGPATPPSMTTTPVAVRAGASTGEASARAASRETSARTRVIPAAVRRAVWARDQGCCSWRSRDGRRCGSRWKLELDHIVPVALGGESTEENLRLICRPHNVRHAEQVFGKHHMSRFTFRATPRPQGGGGG